MVAINYYSRNTGLFLIKPLHLNIRIPMGKTQNTLNLFPPVFFIYIKSVEVYNGT